VKIPRDPDELTAAWLTEALASTGVLAHGRVASCEIQLLGGDRGMTGRIARVRLGYDRALVDAPRSVIAKFSASDPDARASIHGMGFYEREARFYEHLASRSRLRTPRCYFNALDPAEGLALLLLEDLAGAHGGSSLAGCSVAEAEAAVHALAALHAAWWQHPHLEDQHWLDLRSLISVEQAPAIFEQAWEPFLAMCGAPVADVVLRRFRRRPSRRVSHTALQEALPCRPYVSPTTSSPGSRSSVGTAPAAARARAVFGRHRRARRRRGRVRRGVRAGTARRAHPEHARHTFRDRVGHEDPHEHRRVAAGRRGRVALDGYGIWIARRGAAPPRTRWWARSPACRSPRSCAPAQPSCAAGSAPPWTRATPYGGPSPLSWTLPSSV
jgi:hypothetical protein